jgi:hypothetical protein
MFADGMIHKAYTIQMDGGVFTIVGMYCDMHEVSGIPISRVIDCPIRLNPGAGASSLIELELPSGMRAHIGSDGAPVTSKDDAERICVHFNLVGYRMTPDGAKFIALTEEEE